MDTQCVTLVGILPAYCNLQKLEGKNSEDSDELFL